MCTHPFSAIALFLFLMIPISVARSAQPVDFAHEVLPVLRERCAKCHAGGKTEGDISLESRQALLDAEIVEPGNAAGSALVERITSKDAEERMPPEGEPLSAKQISAIRRWIDEGVKWDEEISFLPTQKLAPLAPRRPKLPPAVEGRTNAVDQIVDRYWSDRQIERPRRLGDAAFMRRASLDIVGLLPRPEELEAFCGDRDVRKRARLVRRLLDDNLAYAEHWMTFWNDLLRNDYAGTGYIDGGRMQISGWLHRSLRENKPYDQFVRELIAPTKESEGFIRGIRWRGRVNASQVEELQFAQNVGQVFLGINLKCASCHDSFVDSWKLRDSYALAAVVSERPLELHRCDKPTGKMAESGFLFPELGTIDGSLPRERRLEQLAGLLTHRENGRFTRTIVNRIWHRMMGRGIVHPVDVMDNDPWSADLLDYLAEHLVDNNYDLKKTIELIGASEVYQSQSAAMPKEGASEDYVFLGPLAKRMTAEQFVDAARQILKAPLGKPAFEVKGRGDAPVRSVLVVSDALMRSLGRPNRDQVVTTRPEELTTLVALDLTNGPPLTRLLSQGAENLLRQYDDQPTERVVSTIYLATLAREPTEEEMALAVDIAGDPLTRQGLSDFLWTVFMLPEFQLVR